MRLTTLWAVSSLLLLAGCVGAPPVPDIDGCIVNAPARHLKCYNFARDYDLGSDGVLHLKSGAKASIRAVNSVSDLNKGFIVDTDPATHPHHYEDALAALKAYVKDLRAYAEFLKGQSCQQSGVTISPSSRIGGTQ